ncbi:hypothetical protein PTTG_03226 [Puccinia triticina 1-1 BBBD Race 1]|uniref:Uncharacterized protein n=1 Tax=Puccinia triticina (isolate 1-1 / race 1 (BBBD)) TaxID=630390 RepID=A0A180GTX2_PUCT1|nr:hypothetical protein PTTG_03226 [Puccinia triticina 1-1 BBBD Race 1]
MEADQRPRDAPAQSQASATVDNLSRMLQSFKQRLKKELAVSYAVAAAPSGSHGPLVCYYCHHECHRTARCFKLKKDKEEKLVKQKGTNFFLPNGALSPFNTLGPICHIVASYQPQVSSAATEFRMTCGSLEPWYPLAVSSQSFTGVYESNPAHKKHEVPKPFKAPAVPVSLAKRPVRKAPLPSSGSEAEDMDAEPDLFERSAAATSPAVPTPAAKPEPSQPKVCFKRGIAKEHPNAVNGLLKKISDLPVLNLKVSEIFAISPAVADGMKKWVSRRRMEVGVGEFWVSSGTLMEEFPDQADNNGLYLCLLGYLPCLIGEEGGKTAPLVASGLQLNLISNAKFSGLRY